MLQKTLDFFPHAFRQPLQFALVGVGNTLLDFGIFLILYYQVGAPLVLANSVAFSIAVIQSYLLNKTWTFKNATQDVDRRKQFVLYILVQLGALFLSNISILLFSYYLNPVVSKVIATIVTFVWGFTLSKKVVFGR